jgi:hypothetical protein
LHLVIHRHRSQNIRPSCGPDHASDTTLPRALSVPLALPRSCIHSCMQLRTTPRSRSTA